MLLELERDIPGLDATLWPCSWAGLGAITRWDINMGGKFALAADRMTVWPCRKEKGNKGFHCSAEIRENPWCLQMTPAHLVYCKWIIHTMAHSHKHVLLCLSAFLSTVAQNFIWSLKSRRFSFFPFWVSKLKACTVFKNWHVSLAKRWKQDRTW